MSVMGQSQLRLGFKLWLELFWQIDLQDKDSIWTDAIQFVIRLKYLKYFAIQFEKD